MKHHFYYIGILFIVACGQKSSTEIPPAYGPESGHLEYQAELHGISAIQEVWFEKHGQKQRFQVKFDENQQPSSLVQLDSNSLTSIDLLSKTAQTTSFTWNEQIRALNQVAISHFSDSARKLLQIKELGDTTILDKPCKVTQLTDHETGAILKYWTWENIPLRLEVKQGTFTNSVQCIKMDMNWKPSKEFFQLPDSVIFDSSFQ